MTAPLDHTAITIGADYRSDDGDVMYDPGGHPEINVGLAQYYSRIGRLLAADRVLGSPGLGAGFAALVGQPLTPAVQQQALANAQTTILSDPMTASIAALGLTMPNQHQVQLWASLLLTGQPVPATPLPLTWTITA